MSVGDFKSRLYAVIFGTERGAGRNFDLFLIIVILSSVAALLLDSIGSVHDKYGDVLLIAEVAFTLVFTLEYLARVYCSPNRRAYITSFYGVIDFLAILPTYLSFFIPGAQHLLVIRILRVLRIFRILKLFHYVSEANLLIRALISAKRKIIVFLYTVVTLIIIFGSLMYIIEGPEHGFTSLPRSIYWAIVTITTVGYGDIVPQTVIGQSVAAMAMITSYAIIAIPTGILSAEIIQESQREASKRHCRACDRRGHENDARFCKHCGEELGSA